MSYLQDLKEKRRYERVPASLVCRLRKRDESASGAEGVESTLNNLSRVGVFIETHGLYEKGDIVEFDLELPRSGVQLSIVGSVRWCRPSGPKGIGVEFILAKTGDLERIDEYLDWHSSGST